MGRIRWCRMQSGFDDCTDFLLGDVGIRPRRGASFSRPSNRPHRMGHMLHRIGHIVGIDICQVIFSSGFSVGRVCGIATLLSLNQGGLSCAIPSSIDTCWDWQSHGLVDRMALNIAERRVDGVGHQFLACPAFPDDLDKVIQHLSASPPQIPSNENRLNLLRAHHRQGPLHEGVDFQITRAEPALRDHRLREPISAPRSGRTATASR